MGRPSKAFLFGGSLIVLAVLSGGGLRYLEESRAAPVVPVVAARVAPTPAKPATISAVVKVKRDSSHGSGVHIGGGYIITAAHVVSRPSFYSAVVFKNGDEFQAEVLWSSTEYDIAAIRIRDIKPDNPKVTAPKIANQGAAELFCGTLPVGADVQLVGNPLNDDFITSFGRIAGDARKVGQVASAYVVDIAAIMGVSGGPIFHDGAVAGISSMIMVAGLQTPGKDGHTPSTTGYGYFVPSRVVCDLLARD